IRIDKEQHLPYDGLETWTSKGWSSIKRIIKHKTKKEIYRINTPIASIDVTEDHSLLTAAKEALSPKDAKIGDELFHAFPEEFPSEPKFIDKEYATKKCIRCFKIKPVYDFYSPRRCNHCRECEFDAHKAKGDKTEMKSYFSVQAYLDNAGKNISEEEAWVYGAFLADGSCGQYHGVTVNNSWSIVKKDLTHLIKVMRCLAIAEPAFTFKLNNKIKSGVSRVVPLGNVRTIVQKYRDMFYDKRGYKRIPACILNSPLNIRKSFWDGFYEGDGAKTTKRERFSQRGKITTQGLYYLMRSIGFDTFSIHNYEDHPDIYQVTTVKNKQSNEIKKIIKNIKLPIYDSEISSKSLESKLENLDLEDPYIEVYDIETETGDFLAGVGELVVSNTDSIYLSTPDKNFEEFDKLFYTNQITRRDYWERMVNTSFEDIKPLNVTVNNMFKADTGNDFLKMSYEEFLFPCAFLAKKKYYGIPHISEPNYNLNKEDKFNLFIRGLDLKKRGVSPLLVSVCSDILQVSVDYKNLKTIMEIVQETADSFYKTDWADPEKLKMFVKTGVYKPNKKNVSMHVFRDRMLSERGISLEPGERINYIIAKKYPYKYDLRGRKTALSVGDRMELFDVAVDENIQVDVDYYMENTIIGQLARLITYHEYFDVPIVDHNDIEEIEKAEKKNIDLAKKYMVNYCKKYFVHYADRGAVYKSIFKKSSKITSNKIVEIYGGDSSISNIVKLLGFSVDPEGPIDDWL
ncbi:MAG: hypothetical protein ACRCSG_01175, partial [Cellulosilyticaceae bacterium]